MIQNNIDITETKYYQYAVAAAHGSIVVSSYIQMACRKFLNDLSRPDIIFMPDKADRVIKFTAMLKHTKGKAAGKHFILEPWQEWITASIYGFYKQNSSGQYIRVISNVYIEVSRKAGKGLALDTLIPTPDGWKTMGDIHKGDKIFSSDGKVYNVIFESDIHYIDCYKVTFRKSTDVKPDTVICDADHLWYVQNKRGKYSVMNTCELIDKGLYTVRKDGQGKEYKFRVPICKPVDYAYKELPMDPYTLGVWLGDGDCNGTCFAACDTDLEIYDRIAEIYGNYRVVKDNRKPHTITVHFSVERGKKNPMCEDLRKAGVFMNKHIPEEYLTASYEQRLALLQGLLDTDGNYSKSYNSSRSANGEFVNKNKSIIDGICSLFASLGIQYTVSIKTVMDHDYYRVQFWSSKAIPVFYMKRKYELLPDELNKRMLTKSIISIEKVDSVPTKCIQVDSPDETYLFGENYTVTHNTALIAAFGLYNLCYDGEAGAECVLSATNREQAHICFDLCKGFVNSIDPRGKYFKVLRNSIEYKPNNSKLYVISADANHNDGFSASFGVVDEYHAHPNSSVYDVIVSSEGYRLQPITCVITTAGFNLSSPCKKMRDTCIEILKGLKTDDTQFTAIFELDEGDDWQDPNVWVKSNPNMNVTVTEDYLRKQINGAINDSTKENNVKTKNLNMWVSSIEVWISDNYIQNAMVKDGLPVKIDLDKMKDEMCMIGTDLAAVSDITATVSLFYNESENMFYGKGKFYLPEATLQNNANAEYYKLMKKGGYLTTTEGNVCDYDVIQTDIMKMRKNDIIVQAVLYDRWNSSQWTQNMTAESFNMIPFSQSIAGMSPALKQLQVLLLSGRLKLEYNPLWTWMFQNVSVKEDDNGNIKVHKSAAMSKIDGVIALAQAIGGWMSTEVGNPEIFGLTGD